MVDQREKDRGLASISHVDNRKLKGVRGKKKKNVIRSMSPLWQSARWSGS